MLNTIKIYLAQAIIINNQKCLEISKSIQSDNNNALYSLFKKEPFSNSHIEYDSDESDESNNSDESDESDNSDESDDSDNSDESDDSDNSDESDNSTKSNTSIIINNIIKNLNKSSNKKKSGAIESDLKYQYDISDLLKIMNN